MLIRKRRSLGGYLLVALMMILAAPWGSVTAWQTSETHAEPQSTNQPVEPPADSHSHGPSEHSSAGHDDPVTPLLLGISIVLLGAKLGGDLLARLGQPAVLGELLFGVLIGNLWLAGIDWFEFLRPISLHQDAQVGTVAATLDMLARVGVILLLFEVGLESNVKELTKVGASSLIVALLGVVAPFALGWLVGRYFLPDQSWHVHMFIGATLCATSVGITARVFKDLGQRDSKEAKIILGAAVIDDVLGLVVLAIVQGIIVNGSISAIGAVVVATKALVFLFGALIIGDWLSPKMFRFVSVLRGQGVLMIASLVFCFMLAWLANQMGLAPIVGAFAAGLILDEHHYHVAEREDEPKLEQWILPVTTLLVPIFFVVMGLQVDLRSLADTSVLLLAAGITIAAILGKQACSLGVTDKSVDRLSIGFGMLPRGEVGLIFAAIGQGLQSDGVPVISTSVYSAIVLMVMVTTLLTPILLNWRLRKRSIQS